MLYIVYVIHVVICLFLIMVVLLQQGSGADLSVFGGGGTQTAFGARSATSLLHKLTVAAFIGFILTTIAFGFLQSGGTGDSVMSGVEEAPAVETVPDDANAPAQSQPAVPEEAPAAEGEPASDGVPIESPGAQDGTTPEAPAESR